MQRQILMPRLAEEVEEGVVVTWFARPGDSIREGDLLAELQVQKVSTELRSPFNGRVAELLVEPGGVVAQGAPIAVIDETEAAAAAEIAAVAQAGGNGSSPSVAAEQPLEPLTPMRRAISERLQAWLSSTAQVTLTAEADVTKLAEALAQISRGDQRHASYLEAAVRAVAVALVDHPRVGARLTEGGLAFSSHRDVGIAIALPDGLMTPVVRDADRKDVATLGAEIDELAHRVRAGSIAPADVEGAVISVTNLGAYRIDAFTPLLNPPQTAILGLGRARLRPAVVDGAVAPRMLLVLSLTFDHRVVDGAPAAEFLTKVVALLEEPERLLGAPAEQ